MEQKSIFDSLEASIGPQRTIANETPWAQSRALTINASMNRIVTISLSSMIVIIVAYLGIKQVLVVSSLEKTIQSDFVKEFHQQDNLFKAEAYLGQWRALEIRSQVLVDSLKDRQPSFDFCLDVKISHADVVNTFSKTVCSKGVSSAEMVDFNGSVVGDDASPLGGVRFLTRKQFELESIITSEMVTVLGMTFLFVLLLNRWMVHRLDSRIIQPLLAELAEKAKHETIAKTVQMLAHDIRAPFSSLQTFLKVLQSKPDQRKLEQLVQKLAPEVDKKRRHIESVLNDILDLGNRDSHQRTSEDVELNDFIAGVLDQVFQSDKESAIQFQYDLQNCVVPMDRGKMSRVFENILFNAKQAMGYKGFIFISTEIDRADQAVVTIRNSDSFIPSEHLEHVFDLFYTQGKKRGTGLGLAIAKKIVLEHSGSIRCESSRASGTSFIITLPRARVIDFTPVVMPPDSGSIFLNWRERFATTPTLDDVTTKESLQISSLQKYVHMKNVTNLRLGLIDDEELYVDSFGHIIGTDERLSRLVHLTRIGLTESILTYLIENHFDALIIDVDLGLPFDGNWLTQQIKAVRPKIRICIHSNRSTQDDYRVALSVGADFFLPKPMSKSHLVTFLHGIVANDG